MYSALKILYKNQPQLHERKHISKSAVKQYSIWDFQRLRLVMVTMRLSDTWSPGTWLYVLLDIVHNVNDNVYRIVADSEIGRQWIEVPRTPGSLLQRCLGNSLWWLVPQRGRYSCLQEPWIRVNSLFYIYKVPVYRTCTLMLYSYFSDLKNS